MKKYKPKFRVGQVVSLDKLEYYASHTAKIVRDLSLRVRSHELYQRVAVVTPWMGEAVRGYEVELSNGDRTHEKHLRKLTKREQG